MFGCTESCDDWPIYSITRGSGLESHAFKAPIELSSQPSILHKIATCWFQTKKFSSGSRAYCAMPFSKLYF